MNGYASLELVIRSKSSFGVNGFLFYIKVIE